MAQHYTDTSREHDPHSLPDIETFEAAYGYCPQCNSLAFADDPRRKVSVCMNCKMSSPDADTYSVDLTNTGWFYWFCLRCLPDSEPMGPFTSEDEALADARDGYERDDESIEP